MTAALRIMDVLDDVRRSLADADVPNPRLEARILVSHALQVSMETILGHPERPVVNQQKACLDALVDRRVRREPLAYILGVREFWSLPFRIARETLVPRPETETLVEAALDWIGDAECRARILDLGTGSGCILLALLSELRNAWGVGVDASIEALRIARANAYALKLSDRAVFVQGDWGDGVGERFDIVVTNPPYIAEYEFAFLAPEVSQFEPRLALCGGVDGLAAYRAIVPQLSRLLAPNGAAFLEIGAGAAAEITELLRSHGFQDIEIKSDLAGNSRCIRVAANDFGLSEKKGWKPNSSRLTSRQ